MEPLGIAGYWVPVRDGDLRVLALAQWHYSYRRRAKGRRRGSPGLAGPGEKLVLLTADGRAAFIWRKCDIRRDGQSGVCCTLFRNEGDLLSSALIREADALAYARWPGQRHFTYVNPRRIRSTNPGYCFLQAGWRRCGTSKGGLVILEQLYDNWQGDSP